MKHKKKVKPHEAFKRDLKATYYNFNYKMTKNSHVMPKLALHVNQ